MTIAPAHLRTVLGRLQNQRQHQLFYGNQSAAQRSGAARRHHANRSVRAPGAMCSRRHHPGYKQKAAFGELSFDLLPKQLTLSVGTRLYSMNTYELGSANSGYGCRDVPTGECQNGKNLDADNLHKPSRAQEQGQSQLEAGRARAGLCHVFRSFRPGGFNRGQGVITPILPCSANSRSPSTTRRIRSRTRKSLEDFLVRPARAIQRRAVPGDWLNVQLAIFDPGLYGNQSLPRTGPTTGSAVSKAISS